MRKTIVTASVVGMMLVGCGGGGGETQSSIASSSANVETPVVEQPAVETPVSAPTTEGMVVVPTVKTSDRELAMLYNVNSTLAENFIQQRSITKRAETTIYTGSLKVVDKDGVETYYDWPSYLDADNQIAIAQKTLVLAEGTYDFYLLLESGNTQFVGQKTATVGDTSQLELSFDLYSLIGDVVLNVNEVEDLTKFVVSFDSTQLSNFAEPVLGAVVNGSEETFLNINKATGALEGLLNLNNGDEVSFNFYDGISLEGKSEGFIVDNSLDEQSVDFTPLFGEVMFGSETYEGNTTFTVNFAANTIDTIDSDFETIFKYDNNGNYNEQLVSLVQNADNTYSAEIPLSNVSYGSFNYTLSFVDTATNSEFAKCVAEIPELTSLDVSNTCKLVIQNDTLINNNLLAIFGVNINDKMGIGKEGYSIYVDNEFIGYTGAGTFGTKGFLKSYIGSGEHVLKAQKGDESYMQTVSVDPLSVNNYSFLTDANGTVPMIEANISSENFTVMQGYKDSGTITLTNTGGVEVTYNLNVEEGIASQNRTRDLGTTLFDESRVFKSVDFSNKTVSFKYISDEGDLIMSNVLKEDELPERVIIKYKEGVQRSSSYGFEVKTIDNSSFERFVEELNALDSTDIEYIEPDTKMRLFNLVKPEDELFSYQWGSHNDGTKFGGNEDADTDWLEFFNSYTPTNKQVVVGVIDTGVDYTHPDINDNMWVNEDEIAGNGIDDDNNGYIDDVYGYDFVNNDGNPMDDHGHGTHVSGIIAAEKNTIGIVGVNPYNVKIMALKFLNADGTGYTSDAVKAVQYALDNGAHITNNSWGCTGSGCFNKSLEDVLFKTVEKEQIFVTSSGNDGVDIDLTETYPSNYEVPTVLSVGNSDFRDLIASSSNYGLENVDVLAPGTDIASLWPGNAYVLATGTSMSAPYVTGLVSILYNKGEGNTPYQGIMNNIYEYGDGTEAAKSSTKYGTRINIANSYSAYVPSSEWFNVAGTTSGTLQPGETVTIPFNINLTYEKGSATKAKKITIDSSATPITYDVTVDITK